MELYKHNELATLQAAGCQTQTYKSKWETSLLTAFPGFSWN